MLGHISRGAACGRGRETQEAAHTQVFPQHLCGSRAGKGAQAILPGLLPHPDSGSPCRDAGSRAGSCGTTGKGSGPHRHRQKQPEAAEGGSQRAPAQPQPAPRATASARAPGPPEPESKVRSITGGPGRSPARLARPGPSPSSGQTHAASWSCPNGYRPPSGTGAGQTPAGSGEQPVTSHPSLVLPPMGSPSCSA